MERVENVEKENALLKHQVSMLEKKVEVPQIRPLADTVQLSAEKCLNEELKTFNVFVNMYLRLQKVQCNNLRQHLRPHRRTSY